MPAGESASASRLFAENHGKKQKPGVDLASQVLREWRREVGADPHLRRVFLLDRQLANPFESSPGQAPFEQLALEVFGPLLEHLSSLEDGA